MTTVSVSYSAQKTSDADFEDIVDWQREEDMPENVIWIAIEQKHLNRIARSWTIFSIIVQNVAFIMIIAVFCFISVINFNDSEQL